MMDLDELQSVQSRERQTDSLQQLRESFYQEAGEFIQQLRREREHAADRADDPWNSPEVSRLSDDIDTAENTVEAIYERRVGKIVKMASLAAADMPTEDDGLTAEERELFDSLVARIEGNRDRVHAILDGETPPDPESQPDPESPPDPEATSDSAPASDAAGTAAPGPTDEQSTGTPAVRDEPAGATESDGRTPPPPDEIEPDRGESAPPEATPSSVGDGSTTTTPPEEGRSADESVGAADLMGSGPSEGDADADGGSSEARSADPDDGVMPDVPQTATETDSSDASGPESTRDSGGDEPEATPSGESRQIDDTSSHDRATVKITADVGEIYGVDQRSYDLTTEDVVQLPEANAEPLVERDAAERLD